MEHEVAGNKEEEAAEEGPSTFVSPNKRSRIITPAHKVCDHDASEQHARPSAILSAKMSSVQPCCMDRHLYMYPRKLLALAETCIQLQGAILTQLLAPHDIFS